MDLRLRRALRYAQHLAGNAAEANRCFGLAAAADAASSELAIWIARRALDDGTPGKQAESLQALVKREPNNWRAWLLLAQTLLATGKSGESLAAFEETLKVLPNGAPERAMIEQWRDEAKAP